MSRSGTPWMGGSDADIVNVARFSWHGCRAQPRGEMTRPRQVDVWPEERVVRAAVGSVFADVRSRVADSRSLCPRSADAGMLPWGGIHETSERSLSAFRWERGVYSWRGCRTQPRGKKSSTLPEKWTNRHDDRSFWSCLDRVIESNKPGRIFTRQRVACCAMEIPLHTFGS